MAFFFSFAQVVTTNLLFKKRLIPKELYVSLLFVVFFFLFL